MSKVLVIGDLIIDSYKMCTATRLCPEGPVPVLIQNQPTFETQGGAGLVAAQLKELIGAENVIEVFGSISRKERYFADDRLMLRIDYDGIEIENPIFLIKEVLEKVQEANLIVFSDYSKGTLFPALIQQIFAAKKSYQSIFVDAKNNWAEYKGADFCFPNQREVMGLEQLKNHGYTNVIRKLGPEGCSVNGELIPLVHKTDVMDVTGAGDIFLAGFVAAWYNGKSMIASAEFANKLASASVQYVGTHVVKGMKP